MISDVRVKFGPIFYTIREIDGLENGDGEALYGQAFHRDFEIRLNASGHSPESRFLSLWHEALHVAENVHAVELSEDQVKTLAVFVVQALQDNPLLNWTEYIKRAT